MRSAREANSKYVNPGIVRVATALPVTMLAFNAAIKFSILIIVRTSPMIDKKKDNTGTTIQIGEIILSVLLCNSTAFFISSSEGPRLKFALGMFGA